MLVGVQSSCGEKKRRVSPQTLPNFPEQKSNFLENLSTLFYEFLIELISQFDLECLKISKKSTLNYPQKVMFYRRKVGNYGMVIRRFSLVRHSNSQAEGG